MPKWSNVGNIAGFIAEAILGGNQPTETLAAFREAGGRIRDSRWFQLWKDVTSTVNAKADIMSLPQNRRPADDMFSPWATKKPGMFGYQLSIFTRDRDIGVTVIRQHTIFYDSKVSLAKAINDSLEEVKNDDGTIGTELNEVIEGAKVTALYFTVPIEGWL